jgi:hypothetical protein
MPQTTYPDGFPLAPIEAIDFSYTFSDEEKNEWREWVKTATPEQQQELVETLHAIWMDHKKDVVPAGFEQEKNVVEAAVVAAPASEVPAVQAVEVAPVVVEADPVAAQPAVAVEAPVVAESAPVKQFVFNETPDAPVAVEEIQVEAPAPETPVAPVVETPVFVPKPEVKPDLEKAAQVEEARQNFNQNRNQNQGQQNTQNRPERPAREERNRDNQAPRQENQNRDQRPAREDRPQREDRNNQARENRSEQTRENRNETRQERTTYEPREQIQTAPTSEGKYFDFAKVRESATKAELEKLQKDYLEAKTRELKLKEEFATKVEAATSEAEHKQSVLFEKMLGIVLNFENVGAYLETMTDKLLTVNEGNVAMEKRVAAVEANVENKIKDFKYDGDNLQRDMDRVIRELRDMRAELREEINTVRSSSGTSSVDSFSGDEGMKLKLDLLANKVAKLEAARGSERSAREDRPQRDDNRGQNRRNGSVDVVDISDRV